MALNVETGAGSINADAYISVADADTYLASVGNPGQWDTRANDEKEVAIRRATRFLDGTYRLLWKGHKATAAQALSWPRVHATDEDGYGIEPLTVPERVRQAAAEGAWRSAAGLELAPDSDEATIKRTRQKVGPLENEVEYTNGLQAGERNLRTIEGLLEGLILPAGWSDRG